MQKLEPGQNPRGALPNHRERGPQRFGFTYSDVATAAGCAPSTVPAGCDPRDVGSVSAFITRRLVSLSRRLNEEEVGVWLGGEHVSAWRARWPVFEPWHCGAIGCGEVLLDGQGLCRTHGGSGQVIRLATQDWPGPFTVRAGRMNTKLHRLLVGDPKGMNVIHRDDNRWNNRPENLLLIPDGEVIRAGMRAVRGET